MIDFGLPVLVMGKTQEVFYGFGKISWSIEVLMMCTIDEVNYSATGLPYGTGILLGPLEQLFFSLVMIL